MTDRSIDRPDQAAAGSGVEARAGWLRPILGSTAARAAIIAVKLLMVYVLSQTDAAFFYQQF